MWSTWPRSNPHRKKFEDPAISRLPVPKPKITTSQNLDIYFDIKRSYQDL